MSQIILSETPTGVINLQSKVTEEDIKKSIQSKTEKKLRRRTTFSMPKNLFRLSRRNTLNINNKINNSDNCVKDTNNLNDEQNSDKNRRIFRRASWRKFISRIAQLTVNIGAKHTENTDRVPPLGNYIWPSDQTPGVTGLRNHGNTCFMNAVIQCLSHTDILAEYFVLDQYKADLKRRNKLNSRKFGTKGELTEQLALVLKALWTCKDEPEHSTSFKAVVDRYGTQFRSSTQHDAQEFLFWLLDKVHEDLNQANKRKYKTIKNSYGRSDEVMAAETLANHIRCNNSFVQAVFQAQFRSSLACPRCHKQSNTFDPFHCISVQLPQLAQQAVFVTVLYATQHPKQVKLGLSVPSGSPIVALKEQLQSDTGIPLDRMILAEITETGFSRVLCDSYPISTICNDSGPVYLIESPKPNVVSTNIMLCLANVIRSEKTDVKRFGTPFCVQVSRDISYVDLQKLLLKEMSAILKSEIFSYSTPLTEMFKIRLQDPSADPDTYVESTLEHPLFTEIIDLALSVLPSDAGPSHVKLLLEWKEPEKFFSDMSDPFVEHESVSQMRDKIPASSNLTLVECLEHYTKAETLSAEDAWRCPHCQKYLPVVKTLGLWSLPDILVVHFKRFRQQQLKGPQAAKLTTMVTFPINGFDMSPHMARAPNSEEIVEGIVNEEGEEDDEDNWSPWKKTRRKGSKDHLNQQKDNRYDLYAVCYHQGDTLETGHYTAACKNPYDHEWYKFDDQRINHVSADEIPDAIVNNEAYILFYQRRKLDTAECSGTSSTSGDHWVSKIAPNIGTAPKASTENITEEDIIVKKEVEVKVDDEIEVAKTIQVEADIEEIPVLVEELKIKEDEEIPVVLKIEEEEKENKLEIIEKVAEAINVIPEKEIVPEIKPLVDPVIVDKVISPEKIKIQNSTPNKMQLWENQPNRVNLNFSDIVSSSLHDLDITKRQSRLSTSSYRTTKDCDTISMIRGSNSCSKDTLLYIDQQTQSLIDEDDVLIGNRSHWISPVTPHKLITVSPKN